MRIRIFFTILLLLLLPLISAVEFDMKSDFSQGETLQAKISGNFLKSITKEDIKFFRDHVRTSINPSLEKIDDDFYIYAQLSGKNPNNYSIVIENAQYYESQQIVTTSQTYLFDGPVTFNPINSQNGKDIMNMDVWHVNIHEGRRPRLVIEKHLERIAGLDVLRRGVKPFAERAYHNLLYGVKSR